MNATMRIVPKSKYIRDPATGQRLVKGKAKTVPKINYWLRRLKCGDVELEPKSKLAAPKKAPAKDKEKGESK